MTNDKGDDTMGSTKEKMLRILDILKTTDEQHPITTNKIIEKLRDYSLEPERKSVLRDIRDLIEYGYAIELSEDNKLGWYMAERPFEDWELKILVDAVEGAKFLTRQQTDSLVNKIVALASDDTQRTLKFMTVTADAKTGDTSVKYAIDTIMKAMRQHRKVKFDYIFTDDDGRVRNKHSEGTLPVSPYALVWRKDKYYLIGNYSDSAGLSYYRLDRIRRLEMLSDRAVPLQDILGPNPELELRRLVKQNVYNKKGKKVYLHLQLRTNARDTLIDSFGDDVKIRNESDGTITAEVTVSDGEGLYTWLMHHGSEVVVLGPEHIRDGLRRRLEKMLSSYTETEESEY